MFNEKLNTEFSFLKIVGYGCVTCKNYLLTFIFTMMDGTEAATEGMFTDQSMNHILSSKSIVCYSKLMMFILILSFL